jgi:S-formylglutathione hydrolase FrmB
MKNKYRLVSIIVIFAFRLFAFEDARVAEFESAPSNHVTEFFMGQEIHLKVKYRVIFPPGYSNCEKKEICFSSVYFLHGRNGTAKIFEELGGLQVLNEIHRQGIVIPFIIILPEGQSHYWMNAAKENKGKARWASFVAQQLVSEVENQLPVKALANNRLLAGISMGGHGALQIALNNPGVFSLVAAHSPVLRAENDLDGFGDQFGSGPDYENRDPLALLQKKYLDQKSFVKSLWLDIGNKDPFLERTWNFVELYKTRFAGQDFWFDRSYPVGHDLQYWRSRLREYLVWYKHAFEKLKD